MNELKQKELKKFFYQFKENNMEQYDKLYKEFYDIIYGIVFSVIKNKENTEDVVQEIFIKIYNMDKKKFPEKGELSWLYTVSKNEALQFLRKKHKEINIEEIYEIKEESNELDKIVDMNTYNKMIGGLNEIEKQIVSLKIISNFTFKKIGQMLSIPTATVQWRYYKAVDSLKISLGSLVGFVFTFFLLMGRKITQNKNFKYREDDNQIRYNNQNMYQDTLENEEASNEYIHEESFSEINSSEKNLSEENSSSESKYNNKTDSKSKYTSEIEISDIINSIRNINIYRKSHRLF